MTFEVDVDAGAARFAYQGTSSYAFAVVYVFNRDQGEGIITTADERGAVAASQPFPAQEGDEVVVSFELESQFASTCVRLRDGPSSSSQKCDP
jgi:hypothetical protein